MRPKLFGMVDTASSREYTPHAISTFFRATTLAAGDRFLLVDNDASLPPDSYSEFPIEVIRPPSPRSFGANINEALAEAGRTGSDLFFLNNDLIFTEGWLPPLLEDDRAIVSPLSNGQVQYSRGDLKLGFAMNLDEYVGRETALAEIVAHHRRNQRGRRSVHAFPFFCVKIPLDVGAALGAFDESFGLGGFEDTDYCVRAALAGVPVQFALGSYVLHFQGKSTWRIGGSKGVSPETRAKDLERLELFSRKWGAETTKFFVHYDRALMEAFAERCREAELGALGEFTRALVKG